MERTIGRLVDAGCHHNSRAFLARLAARGFPWDRFRRLTHLTFRAVKMARHRLRRIFSQRTLTSLDVSLLFRPAAFAAGSSARMAVRASRRIYRGIAGPGVYHGARFSEVIRAGIQSIPKTQYEAAVSTGLTVTQAFRLVILPIALRLIVPPATNESVNLLKNSSVALTIGVAELTFRRARSKLTPPKRSKRSRPAP